MSNRKITLSIKARETEEERQAMNEYGSSDSGASLGDILGAALAQVKEKKKASEPVKKAEKEKSSTEPADAPKKPKKEAAPAKAEKEKAEKPEKVKAEKAEPKKKEKVAKE